ncbi:MAG: ArnT family glycosyltransferase [Actinomycetota bacterium]
MAENTDRNSLALPPLSRGVWLIAAFLAVVLLVLAPRYGWHRDELYFLEAGRHLAWGYVDQPPLTPLLARIADTLASGNLVVLRFLPAVAAGATVAVGAATVREMGGRRRSQIAGAGVLATGGFLMGTGHLLSTATFDLLAWIIVLWLTARMLRTRQPRWWIPIGLVAGVAMLNKSLVVMLGVAIVIGLAAARRWDLLRSPWIIAGLCSQPVSPCQISSGRHRTAGRSWR